jgi:bacteriophage CI repressor helix-turn-helix domain
MDKISPIKARILQFIENQGIQKKEFCDKTNISYSNLKGKSLKSEIGGEYLINIVKVYGEISPEWLLTGKGDMLKSSEKNLEEESSENIKLYKKLLEAKDNELAQKQEIILSLKDHINTLKNMPSMGDSSANVG